MIMMTNPSQEPPASSKAPNEALKDMDVLCDSKIMLESQNSKHGCIKDQWPYPNQDQDAKPQSGTSSIIQSLKSGLKGHGCSLHLQNYDKDPDNMQVLSEHIIHPNHRIWCACTQCACMPVPYFSQIWLDQRDQGYFGIREVCRTYLSKNMTQGHKLEYIHIIFLHAWTHILAKLCPILKINVSIESKSESNSNFMADLLWANPKLGWACWNHTDLRLFELWLCLAELVFYFPVNNITIIAQK